jgi:hypothetical protein
MENTASIYTAVKPLLCASKAFGVAPLTYVHDKRRGTLKLTSQPRDVFWVAALLACFLTNLPVDIYVMQFETLHYPLKLNVVAVVFKTCCHLTTAITLIYLSVFKRRSLPRILVLISEVDDLLYGNRERLILYKRTKCFIVLELLITSAIMGPLLASYYYLYPKDIFLKYISSLIEVIEYVSLIFLIVQFTNVVLLLGQRYKYLNRTLDSYACVRRDRTKSGGKNILFFSDMDRFGLLYYDTTCVKRQILERRHIYCKLYDIVLLVNSCFGLPVFILTFWIFMCVVYISYSCVLSIMLAISQGDTLREYIWTLTGFIWCVLCIAILFFIVLSCHATTEECRKSQIIVEKLGLRTGLGYETLNELRVLSVQLNNMKVEFSAAGFFSLDLPFVYSFVGVICTYIVILAQFDWREVSLKSGVSIIVQWNLWSRPSMS